MKYDVSLPGHPGNTSCISYIIYLISVTALKSSVVRSTFGCHITVTISVQCNFHGALYPSNAMQLDGATNPRERWPYTMLPKVNATQRFQLTL